MAARVLTVGRRLPGNSGEYAPFKSDKSLFDADVIVFTPTFQDYSSYENYAGKRLISEGDSPHLITDCAHWRNEINAAVEAGKVVFVMLVKPVEVYYDTGQRTYSGTGRSRVTTRQVDSASSYDSLPLRLERLVPKGGTEISVLSDLGPLAVYWTQFGQNSEYEVYFDASGLEPLLGTKNREKVVGGLRRTKTGGALVFLPPFKWDDTALTYSRGKSIFWKKEGVALGQRLLAALIAASDVLRREGKRTPLPEWAAGPDYSLPVEDRFRAQAARLEAEIIAQRGKELQAQVEEAAVLRALLYEAGKSLEWALLKALRLLGFTAEPYRDGDSEFDAVFISPEGRFLGEAEGKDTKAVNIDKLSQLERNLQEDFAREGVGEFAKGVLFGNPFRLEPPAARGAFFTHKCVTAAKRLHVALVRTPDLFEPARYLSHQSDAAYAEACRRAIFNAEGEVVVFPQPPANLEGDGV